MKINFDSPRFTFFIRIIGGVILMLIGIDIVFFRHQYITETFWGSGPAAIIAVLMVQYKIDYSKKSFKERLLIIISILILTSILYCFWWEII